MSVQREVWERINGNWVAFWQMLSPAMRPAILNETNNPGSHCACPLHGGKDGFRFLSAARGAAVCNTCGTFKNGYELSVRLQEQGLLLMPDGSRDQPMDTLAARKAVFRKIVQVVDQKEKTNRYAEMLDIQESLFAGHSAYDAAADRVERDARAQDLYDRYKKQADDSPEKSAEILRGYFLRRGFDPYVKSEDGICPPTPENLYAVEQACYRMPMRPITYAPAMMAQVCSPEGGVCAFQMVYLEKIFAVSDKGGNGMIPIYDKLGFETDKVLFRMRDYGGAAVPLVPVGDAEVLCVGEGVETMLAFAGLLQGTLDRCGVYACLTAGQLEKFQLPKDTRVKTVIIAADDDHKGQTTPDGTAGRGYQAAEVLRQRLHESDPDLNVLIMRPYERAIRLIPALSDTVADKEQVREKIRQLQTRGADWCDVALAANTCGIRHSTVKSVLSDMAEEIRKSAKQPLTRIQKEWVKERAALANANTTDSEIMEDWRHEAVDWT